MIKKAIPTEYKGVVFDSKSEAVFARTLDLAGHEWVYHPAEHCGHVWDFLVFPNNYYDSNRFFYCGGVSYVSKTTIPKALCEPMLIEYKPSPPTNTYIRNLTEAMRSDPKESIVVWGSPWKRGFGDCCYVSYPIFSSFDRKYGWGNFVQEADNGEGVPYSYRHEIFEMLGITDQMAYGAKEYRFDLQEQLTHFQFNQLVDHAFNYKDVNKEEIKLTTSGEHEFRVKRLKQAIEFLNVNYIGVSHLISELEDHKGDLTCFWKPHIRPSCMPFNKHAVESAWQSVGECNVEHEFLA